MEQVLIIEDDEHIGGLLKFLLERHGFEPLLATDGRAGADAIARIDPPRLVLLDVMLPYHDGFELMQMIRRQPGWAEVPVIMLTAKNMERAFDAGANDYIVKPFQPTELLARLKRFLRVAA
jgi:DNA-binding response OmpR family regulator